MPMEKKQTHIAQWVLPIPKVPDKGFQNEGIYEYLHRISSIDKKIASLMDKVRVYVADFPIVNGNSFGVLLTYNTHIERMREIRDAIGVYSIYDVSEKNTDTFLKFKYPLWRRYSRDNSNSNYVRNLFYTSGYEWWDYFGDYDGITKLMELGIVYLIVSLSDEGIEYLNEIDREVSSLTTV